MRRLGRIFNRIMGWLGIPVRSRPEDIPKKLSPEALEKVMQEARFLYFGHAVDVKSLTPGEVPDLPKPAERNTA